MADHSAFETIDSPVKNIWQPGKLPLRHLSPACREFLKKAGNLIAVNVLEQSQYHLAGSALPDSKPWLC